MTELERRFYLYHGRNPHVYEMFKKFAFAAAFEKDVYSADAVLHRMRWYTEIETKGDRFKINNNYAAYYGRMFMKDYPQHAGFFRTRKLGGGWGGARPHGPAFSPHGGPGMAPFPSRNVS